MAMQDEKIKWIEGTPFMVDGFRFSNPRCQHYLLTHFHSDHTTGLYKNFSAGTIYTSQGTANLVTALIGVNPERVVALPMNTPVTVVGFEITLVDANHCPAAVMFIIRDPRPGGRTALHTGDFRADKSVCANPIVKALKGRVDFLYLDTTYCGPRHAFPEQQEVLAQARKLVRVELQTDPDTLFLVGTYSIGKERVLEAVAKAAGSRCLVTPRKARILRLAGAWDDSLYTTHDAGAGGVDGAEHACVRAVPLQTLHTPTALLGALAEAQAAGAPFTSVVGVRPTGWTHSNSAKEGEQVAKESTKRARALETKDKAEPTSQLAGEAQASGEGSIVDGHRGDLDEESQSRRQNFADSLEGGKGGMGDEAAAWGARRDCVERKANEARTEQEAMSVGVEKSEALAEEWDGGKPRHMGTNARVHSVPYSEHSSYQQLKDFVRTVRPKKIIPTVNASSDAAVERLLKYFLEFMDLSQDRKRLDSYFCQPAPKAASDAADRSTVVALSSDMRSSKPTPAAKRTKSEGETIVRSKAETADNPDDVAPETDIAEGASSGDRRGIDAQAGRLSAEFSRGRMVPNPIVLPPPPRLRCPGERNTTARGARPPAASTTPMAFVADIFDVDCSSVENGVGHAVAQMGEAGRGASSSSAVELDFVDVEAQRAILADIERRKRLDFLPKQQKRAHASTSVVANPYAVPLKGNDTPKNGRSELAATSARGSMATPCANQNRHPLSRRSHSNSSGGDVPETMAGKPFHSDTRRRSGKLNHRGGGGGGASGRGWRGDRAPGPGRDPNNSAAVAVDVDLARASGAAQRTVVVGDKSTSSTATIRDFFGRRA